MKSNWKKHRIRYVPFGFEVTDDYLDDTYPIIVEIDNQLLLESLIILFHEKAAYWDKKTASGDLKEIYLREMSKLIWQTSSFSGTDTIESMKKAFEIYENYLKLDGSQGIELITFIPVKFNDSWIKIDSYIQCNR